MSNCVIGGITVGKGQRGFTRLPVASLLVGADLTLPLHVIHGARAGPVLGITAVVHGAEYTPIRAVAQALDSVDASQLAGTILAIPVANPPGFANRTRNTPERDSDIANLNRVFPGGVGAQEHGKDRLPGDRGMAERIADVIMSVFMPRLNYLVDLHHTQEPRANREAMYKTEGGELGEKAYGMSRAFGCGLLERVPGGMHPGSTSGAAASLGVPCFCAEVGGGLMGRPVEERAVAMCSKGILNVAKYLKMLPGEPVIPTRQILMTKYATVRPQHAGYFIADIEAEDLIGEGAEWTCEVTRGQRLGVVLDPYTLKVVDQLRSPVDGYPYVIRRTGLCEAGDRGIHIAIKKHCEWID